jgi:hypothetical protein
LYLRRGIADDLRRRDALRLEVTLSMRESYHGVPRHIPGMAFLLAAIVFGCTSRATTTPNAPSPSQKDTRRPSAPPVLGVLNQCFVVGDRFLLHARIDARGPNGRIYRQVWSFTCKGEDCHGAQLSLNPFYERKALGALDLNAFKQARAQMHSPSRYVIELGIYTFRIDLVAGRVDVNGAGTQGRDVGSAPCSQRGVLWPPASHGSAPRPSALDAAARRK